MKLRAGNLPVFVIADTFNRVVFVSQGYTIGLGRQIRQVITALEKEQCTTPTKACTIPQLRIGLSFYAKKASYNFCKMPFLYSSQDNETKIELAFPKVKTSTKSVQTTAEVSRKYYVLTKMSTRTYSNDLTKMPKRFYTHLNNSPFKHFEKKY